MKWQFYTDQQDVSCPKFAYIGPDEQVWLQDWEGNRRAISFGIQAAMWPRWSPDGKWIVFFHTSSDGIVVSICSVDGAEEKVLGVFSEEIPIFAYWSPNCKKILLLTQGIGLSLWLCDVEELGQKELLETGGALFFSWHHDGSSILVHVMYQEGAHLVRHYLHDRSPDIISRRAGLFGVPRQIDDKLFFVEQDHGYANLMVFHNQRKECLYRREGYTSTSLCPDMQHIALAGEAAKIELLNLETGQARLLSNAKAQSLWWCNAKQILFSSFESNPHVVKWHKLDVSSEEQKQLHASWPTRSQMFVLHFFEQFNMGQSILDTEKQRLLFAGYPTPQGARGYTPRTQIYTLDVHEGTIEPIAEGTYPSLIPNL